MKNHNMNKSLESNFPGQWRNAASGYRYFLPADLFTTQDLNIPFRIQRQLEESSLTLGRFASLIEKIPNPTLFIHAYTKKEATLSSRIEGTQTEIADAFKNEQEIAPEKREDWAEVKAYIQALDHALERLEELPLCNRLLCEAHERLLAQVRGKNKQPGEFRRSQNWIGGSRPENAHFVPPAHEHVADLMANLEKFIDDDSQGIPHLIKAACIHYQFETIHPFLDGNGRIGRMLISLYLLQKKVLQHPILYISAFLEANRSNYYDALDRARKNKEGFIDWISFFLDAVEQSAQDGITVTQKLMDYDTVLREQKIPQLGRRAKNGLRLLDQLYEIPFISAASLQKTLQLNASASQALLKDFMKLGILTEMTGHKRNRVFLFKHYLHLLSGIEEEEHEQK